MELLTNTDTFK